MKTLLQNILNYHENLDGQRDFVNLIGPFLDEYGRQVDERADRALKPFELARKKHFATTEEEKARYESELRQIFSGEIEVVSGMPKDGALPPDDSTDDKISRFIRFKVKGDTDAINTAFEEMAKTRFHKAQLYKSSLISLLSTVEWFFSQTLHFYYDRYPDAAGVKNKTLTLDELKSFPTVKDAETYLIENKIEEILRGSIKDWFKILESELKLGLGYKTQYEDELLEIYQRRNLLVHNGGIVNSIYLSKVSPRFRAEAELGKSLEVDEDYLKNAIVKLELVFTLMACELWQKLAQDDEERGALLMRLQYRYLEAKNWDVAECANRFIWSDKRTPIANRTAAQLNVWLCKKETGKYSDIQKEVEEADFSDKSLTFQVVLAALRGNKEFFFDNIDQVLRTEELAVKDLFEFPIFREIRESDEFTVFISTNEAVQEYLGSSTPYTDYSSH